MTTYSTTKNLVVCNEDGKVAASCSSDNLAADIAERLNNGYVDDLETAVALFTTQGLLKKAMGGSYGHLEKAMRFCEKKGLLE